MPQKCHVVNCTKPTVAHGLCNTHYMRERRNGTQETLRPDDWGDRRKHAAYPTWKVLRRAHGFTTDQRWLDNFWTFAKEVPPKPEGVKSTGARSDPEQNWGPDNFYWKTLRTTQSHREDRAAYMREWQRSLRAADPEYGKNAYLKKRYGVDLAWFKAKQAEQKDLCAICDKPETAVIHGRVISLAVDHCHDTGKARALLCRSCNNAIGAFEHNVEMLQSAIRYLEKHAPDDVTDLV